MLLRCFSNCTAYCAYRQAPRGKAKYVAVRTRRLMPLPMNRKAVDTTKRELLNCLPSWRAENAVENAAEEVRAPGTDARSVLGQGSASKPPPRPHLRSATPAKVRSKTREACASCMGAVS